VLTVAFRPQAKRQRGRHSRPNLSVAVKHHEGHCQVSDEFSVLRRESYVFRTGFDGDKHRVVWRPTYERGGGRADRHAAYGHGSLKKVSQLLGEIRHTIDGDGHGALRCSARCEIPFPRPHDEARTTWHAHVDRPV